MINVLITGGNGQVGNEIRNFILTDEGVISDFRFYFIGRNILDKKVPKDKRSKELITFVEDRAGNDRRYAIDATKIENELGWKADEDFESGIIKTIDWYFEKYSASKN